MTEELIVKYVGFMVDAVLRQKTTAATGNLLSPDEVCNLFGIADSTLRYWRMVHTGPRFVRLSARCFRYDERDVERYISERRIDPSARAALETPRDASLS